MNVDGYRYNYKVFVMLRIFRIKESKPRVEEIEHTKSQKRVNNIKIVRSRERKC